MTTAIVFTIVVAYLALAALGKTERAGFHVPTTAPDPDPSTGWVIGGRILVVLLLLASIPIVAARLGGARLPFGILAIAGVLAFGATPGWVGAVPWVLARRPKLAFRWMRLTSFDPERLVSAVLEASLALARMDREHPEFAAKLAFLEKQLDASAARGPTGLVATGLIAALRGDDETARAIFHWIDASPRRLFPARIRRIALRWLVADHARRGDFAGLAERMRGRAFLPWLTTPYCLFLGRVASRLADIEPLPSNRALRLAHGLVPNRSLTRPLLDRALAKKSRTSERRVAATPSLAQLLRAHLVWLRERGGRPAMSQKLLEVARACDSLRESASGALDERTARVLARIEADLEWTVAERGICLEPFVDESPTLDAVFDRLGESLFRDIDARLDQLRARIDTGRATSAIDEWIEWANLHEAITRAYRLGGERWRRGAFAEIHHTVCDYAVWLFNERRFHLLGHGIFRWLLTEAEWVCDPEAFELQQQNVSVQPA